MGTRRQAVERGDGVTGTAAVLLWVVIGACCVLPLLWLAWQLVHSASTRAWLPTRYELVITARTLAYAGLVGVLAAGLAVPAALAIGRGHGFWVGALLAALPLSLLMPSISYAYGWSQLLIRLGVNLEPAGTGDVGRCIWTLAAWLWPVFAAAVGLWLRRADSQVQQQALLDGALWRVTTRQLSMPAAAATAAVVLLSMQEFSVWETTGISVVGTEVRMVFEGLGVRDPAGAMGLASTQNQRAAAAVAAAGPMLLVVAVVAAAGAWAILRNWAPPGPEEGWPAALDAPWWSVAGAWIVLAGTVGAPIAGMVLSLQRPMEVSRMWHTFSPFVAESARVAVAAGLAALLLTLLASLRPSRAALGAALAAFMVGGLLLCIADIRLYNRSAIGPVSVEWIYGGATIVVMGMMGRFAWLAMLSAQATWSRSAVELRQMAALDGASPLQAALWVIWPTAWPLLASSALLVMILSLTEVPVAMLLGLPDMFVRRLMIWVHIQDCDDMIEGSLLLTALVLALGGAAVGLAWAGLRAWRGIAVASMVAVLAAGCGRGDKPQAIWCETGMGPAQVIYPRGIARSPVDGTYFVVDCAARVQRLDAAGKCLAEWRMPDYRHGKPTGLSVGPDGNVYIADTHYQRVMVYAPNGTLLRQWGSPGQGPGQFIFPTDVAFDADGNVYVSEYGGNDRIQVFDGQGNLLRQIGRFGDGPGEFSRPQSIVIVGWDLYVADSCNHRIQLLDLDGTHRRTIGSVGSELGQFRFPYGLDMDGRGRLVVCEFGNNRVQLIDPQTGRSLRAWGAAGRRPGQLAYPWAVAAGETGRVVVVDSGNNRMQVFRF